MKGFQVEEAEFLRHGAVPLDAGVFSADVTTDAASCLVILPDMLSPWEDSMGKDSSSCSVVRPAEEGGNGAKPCIADTEPRRKPASFEAKRTYRRKLRQKTSALPGISLHTRNARI